MAFKQWTGKGRVIRRPWVTLGRGGDLFINREADRLLGCPAYVTLWFNDRTRQAGLKPARGDDEGVYKVHRNKRTGGATISIKAFAKAYGIAPGRYFVKTEGKMLVFWVGGHQDDDEKTTTQKALR